MYEPSEFLAEELTDGRYQEHYLPASLSDPVDNQLGVSFDKDFALLGIGIGIYLVIIHSKMIS